MTLTKVALGALQEELMLLQFLEYQANVLVMLRPRGVVNQNVIEEDEDEPAKKWLKNLIHQRLKHTRALDSPKGMTKNSNRP
jgi:hypothetical protein